MFGSRWWPLLLAAPLMVACPQTSVPQEVSLSSDPRALGGAYSATLTSTVYAYVIGVSATQVYDMESGRGTRLVSRDRATGRELAELSDSTYGTAVARSDDHLVRRNADAVEVLDGGTLKVSASYPVPGQDAEIIDAGRTVILTDRKSGHQGLLATSDGSVMSLPDTPTAPASAPTVALGLWRPTGKGTLLNLATRAEVRTESHHGNPCWYFNNPPNSAVVGHTLYLGFPDGRVEAFGPDGALVRTLIFHECTVESLNPRLSATAEGLRVDSSTDPLHYALLDPATDTFQTRDTPQTAPLPVADSKTLLSYSEGGRLLWTIPRATLPVTLTLQATLPASSGTGLPSTYHVRGTLTAGTRSFPVDTDVYAYGAVFKQNVSKQCGCLPQIMGFSVSLKDGGQEVGTLDIIHSTQNDGSPQQATLRLDAPVADTFAGPLDR